MAHKLNESAKVTQCTEYGKRDVEQEFDGVECTVEGKIPEWIQGTIYKQAGGAFGKNHNQLDGLAHLACFKLENGKGFFSNKFMRTQDYAEFINSGERKWNGVSTGSNTSAWSAFSKTFKNIFKRQRVPSSQVKYKNFNPNVTTWFLDNGNIVAAQTENGGILCQVDPSSLDTIGELSTMKAAKKGGQLIQTPAHFFRDGENGGYHVAVELKVDYKTIIPTFTFFYNIYVGDSAPLRLVNQEEICKFKWTQKEEFNKLLDKRPSYMHGVAVSENYFIRIETSCKYDLVKLLNFDIKDGFFSMTPFVDTPIVFTVFKRCSVEREEELELLTKIVSEQACMVWHVANCFENEAGNIVIETSCSEELYEKPNFFGRFTLDLKNECSTFTHLLAEHEFPVVSPSTLMSENKYVYLLKGDIGDMSLVKYEISRNETKDQALMFELYKESHFLVSEPCFVGIQGGREDEGYVLVMVADQEKEESFLALINGETGNVEARVMAPTAINIGLHTVYIPSSGLDVYRSKM